jgi:hypothetical protein
MTKPAQILGYEMTPKQKAFVAKAKRKGFEPYFTYSELLMFGEKCPAVNHSPGDFWFKGASQDSMGFDKVTYMPRRV